jgi:hypothetical protein
MRANFGRERADVAGIEAQVHHPCTMVDPTALKADPADDLNQAARPPVPAATSPVIAPVIAPVPTCSAITGRMSARRSIGTINPRVKSNMTGAEKIRPKNR